MSETDNLAYRSESETIRQRFKRHAVRVALMFLLIFVSWAAFGAFVLNRPTLKVLWVVSGPAILFFWALGARFSCPKCGSRLGYTDNACRNCGVSFDERYPIGHGKSTSSTSPR